MKIEEKLVGIMQKAVEVSEGIVSVVNVSNGLYKEMKERFVEVIADRCINIKFHQDGRDGYIMFMNNDFVKDGTFSLPQQGIEESKIIEI